MNVFNEWGYVKGMKKPDDVVKRFRAKVKKKGHTLKWWHRENLSTVCRYDYFIRMICSPEIVRDDVLKVISDYLKK